MKTFFQILIALAAGLVVLAVAGMGLLYFVWPADSRSDWQKPAEQHLTSCLPDVQRDRDALLQTYRSAQSITTVEPESLPDSLRVPGLKFALVHSDHLTLILYHSPDTDSGFRIWKSAMPADFADQATTLPFVTRFSYCDDYPNSPANKLE